MSLNVYSDIISKQYPSHFYSIEYGENEGFRSILIPSPSKENILSYIENDCFLRFENIKKYDRVNISLEQWTDINKISLGLHYIVHKEYFHCEIIIVDCPDKIEEFFWILKQKLEPYRNIDIIDMYIYRPELKFVKTSAPS